MGEFDGFLEVYGPAALFSTLLAKAAGIPIPIPADLLMLTASAWAVSGRVGAWQLFGALLVALVLGSLVQYALARGPGRGVLRRYGPYVGLTPTRLDAAGAAVQRGGWVGVGLAVLTPGVRAASVAACGVAGVPLRVFLPGLVAGSAAFLGLHFALGYAGGAALAAMPGSAVPLALGAVAVVLVGGALGWVAIRRGRGPARPTREVAAEVFGAWHEAACPACLVLGASLGVERPRVAPQTA